MANHMQTDNQMSSGKLIGGLLALLVWFGSLSWLLIQVGGAKTLTGLDKGLIALATIAGLGLAAVFGPSFASLMEREGVETKDRAPWLDLLSLAALVAAVSLLLVLGAKQLSGAEWGKVDTTLAVLVGIALVFAAVSWWDALSRGVTSRGTMLQVNAGVSAIVVLGILILVNKTILPNRLGYVKADLTKEKYYSLSEQTTNLLQSLKKEQAVEIIGLIPSGRYSEATELITKRFDEYDRLNANVTAKVLDPNTNPEGQKLAFSGALTALPGTIVRFKDNPDTYEGANGTDESEITRALMKLLKPSSRVLYFLTGSGEVGFDDTESYGASTFKKYLENDRFEPKELNLTTAAEVPADAACVVAIWPKQPYRDEDLAKLEAYLSAGGRLLAFLEPGSGSNLGEVTAKFGVEVQDGEAKDPTMQWGQDPSQFLSVEFADQDVTKFFQGGQYAAFFFGPGYLTKGIGAGDWEYFDLVKTSVNGFAETTPAAPAPVEGEEAPAAPPAAERTNGPLTLIMAATTKDDEPKDEEDDHAGHDHGDDDEHEDDAADTQTRIRLAVVADGEFIANIWERSPGINFDIATNLVSWLTDDTSALGIRAKDPFQDMQERQIQIDAKGRRWVLVLCFLLPVALIGVAGTAVYIARR